MSHDANPTNSGPESFDHEEIETVLAYVRALEARLDRVIKWEDENGFGESRAMTRQEAGYNEAVAEVADLTALTDDEDVARVAFGRLWATEPTCAECKLPIVHRAFPKDEWVHVDPERSGDNSEQWRHPAEPRKRHGLRDLSAMAERARGGRLSEVASAIVEHFEGDAPSDPEVVLKRIYFDILGEQHE